MAAQGIEFAKVLGVMRLPSSASLSKVKAGIMSARARSRPSARI
jgi:hypothetical protein